MRRVSHVGGQSLIGVLAVFFLAVFVGCSSNPTALTSDPLAKVRLTRLLKFYKMYTNQKKKPPPNEQAFKEFIQNLPADEKEAAGVTADVDSFLISPGDGQKYHFEYGLTPNPSQNRALAWEQNGQDGMRYVALTMGYVQRYNEEDFQNYKKKK